MRCARVIDLVNEGALRVEDGNHGNDRPRPEDFESTGVAFIRAADMTSGVVNFSTAGRINPVARARIRKGVGAPGDVILSHKGTVGKVAVAPADSPEFVCSPQTTFWRSLDESLICQKYLRYVLISADFRRQLDLLKGQTDMAPYVSLTDQRSMTLVLPKVAEQVAIAEILGALDNKIAANTKLIGTGEQLSKSLFESMLRDGGRSTPLSQTAQFVNGKAFTKNASGTGRVVIRIAELNSGLGGSTVYNDIDVDDEFLAQPGSILFAWSGSLTLHRWFRAEGIINQHIFKVIPAEGYPAWLIFELLRKKLVAFKSIAADKATTMGHIQRKHLDEPVLVPASDTITAHDSLMQALWQQNLNAEMANESLAATRDALLPQLMSGKLRVKDAEALVAAAV